MAPRSEETWCCSAKWPIAEPTWLYSDDHRWCPTCNVNRVKRTLYRREPVQHILPLVLYVLADRPLSAQQITTREGP